jgi:hypothetical protein
MWELIGFTAGLLVLLFLYALLPYVFDLPDSIAKYFASRPRPSQIEQRLLALESQLNDIRNAIGMVQPQLKNDTSFNHRLNAVIEISDVDCRDEALCKVAADASAAADATTALMAISKISDSDMRNETASTCALKLAKVGKNAEAIELSKTIPDVDQRDETLSAIAAI